MLERVNPGPVLFAQSLEIKDRQRFWCFKGIAEDMGDLLRDRSMLALRPSLKLLIESVGKAFDIEDCHALLPSSSIMEEPSCQVKANQRIVR